MDELVAQAQHEHPRSLSSTLSARSLQPVQAMPPPPRRVQQNVSSQCEVFSSRRKEQQHFRPQWHEQQNFAVGRDEQRGFVTPLQPQQQPAQSFSPQACLPSFDDLLGVGGARQTTRQQEVSVDLLGLEFDTPLSASSVASVVSAVPPNCYSRFSSAGIPCTSGTDRCWCWCWLCCGFGRWRRRRRPRHWRAYRLWRWR